ncbi:MAG: hypothetical protein U0Q12_24425 [Vicinamibacterales bacterium]
MPAIPSSGRAGVLAAVLLALTSLAGAQTDLDTFMETVLAKRDDNWKKLQQYVLDERELVELRGPSHVPLWGERREYMWYPRDGFFVRSPVKVNGAAVPESDRRKYERDYLARVQAKDRRHRGAGPDGPVSAGATGAAADPPGDADHLDALIQQTRQPEFVSSAYFLRFKFDEGHYALAGREQLDGVDVLRVEYYPSKLFASTRRRPSDKPTDEDAAFEDALRRLMNKSSLVTLWIAPADHQIVQYTFENVALDFLPAQWLVHLDSLRATMRMAQPFPDVWLPRDVEVSGAMTLAVGQIEARYGLQYANYKRADVATSLILK